MASSSRPTLNVLGFALVGTVAAAFIQVGSVGSGAQALLNVLVACLAAVALTVPDRKLESAGVVVRWALAGLLPIVALAIGLVPVPRAVASIVAPGLLDAQPTAAWMTLATDATPVPGEIATFVLVLAFGALVATWGSARSAPDETEFGAAVVAGVLGLTVAGHAALGARSVFGLASPVFVPTPFYAPFVNPNHAGSAMLLGGPIAFGLALNRDQEPWKRALGGLFALVALGLLLSTGSSGAMIAAGVVAVVWVLRAEGVSVFALAILVAMGMAAVVIGMGMAGIGVSVSSRASLWHDALHLLSAHWLAGSGGGTFGDAIRPYRSDVIYQSFAHAHNEPLEWVVETGLVGAIAAVAAVAIAWPGRIDPARRGDGLAFGLLGLGVHACVEFPLQVPASALAASGVAGALFAVFAPPRPSSPRTVRAVVLALGLVQLPAAAWQARQAVVNRAIDDIDGFDVDAPRAVAGADALVPARADRPEGLLLVAWSAQRAGDEPKAITAAQAVRDRFPDRPDALREAALVFARAGRYADATSVLERVVARDPSDYRPWVALARVAHAQKDDLLAAQRWSEAFHRHAPGLDEAFADLPSGLYWLQALSDCDGYYSKDLAYILSSSTNPADLEVALMACDQAADLDPALREYLQRASILVSLGRPGDAEAWLAEILTRRPDDPDVLTVYARVLGVEGRHDDATEALLHGARARPELRRSALQSAETAGGPQHALDIARRFELEGTMDPSLELEIAALHLRAGDRAGCVAAIERWSLPQSVVGTQAAELLRSCRERPL